MASISGIYSQTHLAMCDIHHKSTGMNKAIKKAQRKKAKAERKKARNAPAFTPVIVRRPKQEI